MTTSRSRTASSYDEARGYAANLQALGVGPGDHVALLGPTSRPLVTAIQAIWLTGATVVVLPLPMRLSSIEEFVAQTRARIINADVSLVLVDPELAPFIEPVPGDPPMVEWDAVQPGPGRLGADAWERPPDDLDRLAILQFTSGSTSDPKGVMLPHRTVGANLDAIARATSLDPDDDVLVSWLPLYHDMGLVGSVQPLRHHRHAAGARRPDRLHGRPGTLDGVDVHVRRDRDGRTELLLRPRRPRARSGETSSTCLACGSP